MKSLRHRKVPRTVDLDRACVILEGGTEYCIYPMDDILTALARKWALFIIAVVGNTPRVRFNDLLRQLKGISPRTLTDRLRELERLRLIERRVFPEVPLRVEYTLTPSGRNMRRALIPFLRWSVEFETQAAGGPG